jgi:hypothetical protein
MTDYAVTHLPSVTSSTASKFGGARLSDNIFLICPTADYLQRVIWQRAL